MVTAEIGVIFDKCCGETYSALRWGTPDMRRSNNAAYDYSRPRATQHFTGKIQTAHKESGRYTAIHSKLKMSS